MGAPSSEEIEESLRNWAREPETLGIADAALMLSVLDRPQLDLAPYGAHLVALAGEVRVALERHAPAEALRRVLAVGFGYAGDQRHYDAPENADLAQVIDRRLGLPVALGILYIHAGQAAGARVEGVRFPGHFLVRALDAGAVDIIDPFHGGRTLDDRDMRRLLQSVTGADSQVTSEMTEPTGNVEVVLRLLANQKIRAVQTGNAGRALAVLRRMLWLAPDDPALLFETGMRAMTAGQMASARAMLERCIAVAENDAMRRRAEVELSRVYRYLN